MAHFAELDDNNIVLRVVVISNNVTDPENTGTDDESLGIAKCKKLWGDDTNWVQASYNANFRKQYAGFGFWYDAENDIFVAPKPAESWVLADDYVTAGYLEEWIPPTPHPDPTQYRDYWWHEPSLSWIKDNLE